MQYFAFSLLACPAFGAALISKHAAQRVGSSLTTDEQAEEAVHYTPRDIFECSSVASKFLMGPTRKVRAQEKALDFCVANKLWATDYSCSHLRDGLADAFREEPEDKEFTPDTFCKVAEQYMLDMRGSSRFAEMGSGTLYNFHASSDCTRFISNALSPNTSLATPDLAELLYDECANPGCAHKLPSKHRPCESDRPPTRTNSVCDAVWRFATQWAQDAAESELNATGVCDVYSEFVLNRGHVVRSYEHVMHSKNVKHIPVPTDRVWALQTSQFLNAASWRFLRDNAGGIHTAKSGGCSATPWSIFFVSLLPLTARALA